MSTCLSKCPWTSLDHFMLKVPIFPFSLQHKHLAVGQSCRETCKGVLEPVASPLTQQKGENGTTGFKWQRCAGGPFCAKCYKSGVEGILPLWEKTSYVPRCGHGVGADTEAQYLLCNMWSCYCHKKNWTHGQFLHMRLHFTATTAKPLQSSHCQKKFDYSLKYWNSLWIAWVILLNSRKLGTISVEMR